MTRRTNEHRPLVLAIALSIFSIAWNVLTGGVATVVAFKSRSPSLAGFGLDATIDAAASVVLVWHFTAARRDLPRANRVERTVTRCVAAALLVAAVYVAARSIALLAAGAAPGAPSVGVAIAVASVLVLPWLAIAKVRAARALGSAALRSDAILTAGAALLAAVTLIGLALQQVGGVWWIDSAMALAIAVAIAAEGGRALIAARS